MSDPLADWPRHARALFEAVTVAADPERLTRARLPEASGFNSIRILALGKAALAMTKAAEDTYARHPDVAGLVIAREPGAWMPARLRFLQGAHPVPDERSLKAGEAALELAAGAGPATLFLVLLSGGGSALAVAPKPGVSLAAKQQAVKELLVSGADIAEINAERQRMSRLKGGGLARAASGAGAIVTLALSDVAGDDPATIASGPTWVPGAEYRLIGSGRTGLEAASAYAQGQGWVAVDWGDALAGDVRKVAADHAPRLVALQQEIAAPTLVISGGELTSVLPPGAGAGGPNQDYILSLMTLLSGAPGIAGLAFDTDGCDGVGGGAGGWFVPESLALAGALGLDPKAALTGYASLDFLKALGSLIPEAPTGTNINDFRAILLMPLTKA